MSTVLTLPKSRAPKKDSRLDPNSDVMKDYTNIVDRFRVWSESILDNQWAAMMDNWDLFLAQQEDKRDPLDEDWRSNVFVPLPYVVTRTKAAQAVKNLAHVDRVWQVEARHEKSKLYEGSKNIELLLDEAHEQNSWRKFLYKLMLARSVQGTAYFKIVYTRRQHTVTLVPAADDFTVFQKAVADAVQQGAPVPPDYNEDPQGFENWREMLALTQRFSPIPAPPVTGPRVVTAYDGPLFQYIAPWRVLLDPTVDELADQRIILHTMIKPRKWVLDRADDDPSSNKPYYLANVKEGLGGNFSGEVLSKEEEELAQKLNLSPEKRNHPYYENAVEITEAWTFDEEYKFGTILNRTKVINKKPFERPLLTMDSNIFALRNVVIPGQFLGLSDYKEIETLVKELNTFRRVRMDGAMLSALPAFVKQAGVNVTDMLKKLRPGIVISAPTKDAITALISKALPPEAYREPAEMRADIEEATETYSSVKGAPAEIGRVTGTEYSGRNEQTLVKYLVDAGFIEEELKQMPATILSLYATMTTGRVRREIGGDPDALVDVSREELINAIMWRYRFRGATRNIKPELQVQQLTTALAQFLPLQVLQPTEIRAALQIVLELLDIRGFSKILTTEGAQTTQSGAGIQQGAANAQGQRATDQAQAAGVQVPGQMDPQMAQQLGGAQPMPAPQQPAAPGAPQPGGQK